MKSQLRMVKDGTKRYTCLAFICPGCILDGRTGLHLLPVNTEVTSPSWTWDMNLEQPTISPSILTGKGTDKICHSFLVEGKFNFLDDCTHALSGKQGVEMPDLPDWFIRESEAPAEEPYIRVDGSVMCLTCGKPYAWHRREYKNDAYDGQNMVLVRSCDGRLLKL